MSTQRQDAENGKHNARTSPGWYLARDGAVEGCIECGFNDDDEVVEQRASDWIKTLPKVHEANEECSGCCGFNVFEPHGSMYNRTRWWIEIDSDCSRQNDLPIKDDEDAIEAACKAAEEAGFIVVDGQ